MCKWVEFKCMQKISKKILKPAKKRKKETKDRGIHGVRPENFLGEGVYKGEVYVSRLYTKGRAAWKQSI